MAIATLSIDLEARLARLEEGLDRAARINAKTAGDMEQRWRSAGSAVRSALAPLAAAFSVEALRRFVVDTAGAVDALNDISDATGSTVENISALQDVALRTGTPIQSVETALIKMNQALAAAKSGSDVEVALKSIGISAKELKAQDPAEALRKVAVALSGFADDGNKARLIQELFGKSLREVAPLLKDLATQTQLTATITRQQAEEAERFAKAMGQFDAAVTRAKQSLITDLLPTLTVLQEELASSAEGASFFSDLVRVPIEALAILGANVAFVLKALGREIGAITAQMAALATLDINGFSAIGDAVKADAIRARKELDDFERRLLDAGKSVAPKPSGAASSETLGSVAVAEVNKEFDQYLKRLEQAKVSLQNLGEVDKARLAISSGELGQLSKEQDTRLLKIAREIDLKKASAQVDEDLKRIAGQTPTAKLAELDRQYALVNKAFNEGRLSSLAFAESLQILDASLGAIRKDDAGDALKQLFSQTPTAQLAELDQQYARLSQAFNEGRVQSLQYAEALQILDGRLAELKKNDIGQELKGLISQTPSAQLEEIARQYERLNIAFDQGRISAVEFSEALQILGDRQKDVVKAAEEAKGELSEFAKQAQRNIQDALGDTLLAGLQGRFDSIGELWRDLLQRMLAQALATKLNEALFGGGSGGGDGLLSAGFAALFGSFGGGRASGGPVTAGTTYLVGEQGPELFRPWQSGTIVPNGRMGGAGGSVALGPINIRVDARSDQAQVAQVAYTAARQAQEQQIKQLKAMGALRGDR